MILFHKLQVYFIKTEKKFVAKVQFQGNSNNWYMYFTLNSDIHIQQMVRKVVYQYDWVKQNGDPYPKYPVISIDAKSLFK